MLKKYIITFLISMVPLIELRGSIPIGLSSLWGDPIPVLPLYIICILGNMLPVPFIYLFARRVLEWGADKKYIGKFFKWCLEKGEKGGKKLQEKAGKTGLFFALLIFVGIPLPGTGAWTGTLAASILDMDFKRSILAVMLGVILAGIIMAILGFTHIRKDFGAKTRISIFIFDIIFAIYGNVRNRNTYVYMDNVICYTNSNICL